ncbi:YlzJ-like family protein [Bacillus sp. CLL-7-23]|uniref:YlzJ-like family protein n=1 Tax=Bacillus changyiensis TaxID=3004103 RepID=A0ABT4X0H1_9BACI|nr:YlzJ-like family protein [Bacillus changyiensis]MDA7025801.1 YlzJ-like family protein [Bacillus changyiensis]
MILYTMMPHELVFGSQMEETNRRQVDVNGVPLLIEMNGEEAKVIQILSTNPMDFLNQETAPGQTLKLTFYK